MGNFIRKLDDLEIYKESLLLAKAIFDLCKDKAIFKEYSLCDQIKRAAMSVCANIAEGYGRHTNKDFSQFLSIALGSCNETMAFLDIINLSYQIPHILELKDKYDILGKRIYSFRIYVSNRSSSTHHS